MICYCAQPAGIRWYMALVDTQNSGWEGANGIGTYFSGEEFMDAICGGESLPLLYVPTLAHFLFPD